MAIQVAIVSDVDDHESFAEPIVFNLEYFRRGNHDFFRFLSHFKNLDRKCLLKILFSVKIFFQILISLNPCSIYFQGRSTLPAPLFGVREVIRKTRSSPYSAYRTSVLYSLPD